MTSITRRTAALIAAATLALTGCSDEQENPAGSTVPESEPFNQADVDFATDMIPHHAQALLMVDAATEQGDLSPVVTELVEQIRAEQTGEIEQMTDWLQVWEQPVPDNPRDHGGMGDDHMGDMADMPGIASRDELDALEEASGADFEQRWLQLMIAHHEGAIEMAEEEVDDGEFPETVALATQITASQADEIERMEQLLG